MHVWLREEGIALPAARPAAKGRIAVSVVVGRRRSGVAGGGATSGVADRLAACLVDRRAPDQITHSLSDIIRFDC